MAANPPVTAGTIWLNTGDTTVFGAGTSFQTDGVTNDLLVAGGHVALIQSVTSELQCVLYGPWTGPNLVDSPYAIFRIGAVTPRVVALVDRINALTARIENVFGSLPAFMTDTFLTATDADAALTALGTTAVGRSVARAADAVAARAAIGLGNVADLAPADLPVSAATQAALDSRLELIAHDTFSNAVWARTNLGGFVHVELDMFLVPAVNGTGMNLRVSADNGVTWQDGANAYYNNYIEIVGGGRSSQSIAWTSALLGANVGHQAVGGHCTARVIISQFNQAREALFSIFTNYRNDAGAFYTRINTGVTTAFGARNALLLLPDAGGFSEGRVIVKAVRG